MGQHSGEEQIEKTFYSITYLRKYPFFDAFPKQAWKFSPLHLFTSVLYLVGLSWSPFEFFYLISINHFVKKNPREWKCVINVNISTSSKIVHHKYFNVKRGLLKSVSHCCACWLSLNTPSPKPLSIWRRLTRNLMQKKKVLQCQINIM